MESNLTDISSVLVVDDNPLIINVLRSLLCSEGYKVFTCGNGHEALDLLGSKSVDLIICDVMMPRMDGYELHFKVRENNQLAHIPFVFLTALSDNVEVNRGLESGADDYVVKPFDPQDLVSLVKGKIRRSKHLKTYGEEKYDSYRKRVIHTLSHEFRTPLVAINTGTELLLDQVPELQSTKVHNVLEAIKRGGQRLERLVTDFMLLQQIEAGIAHRLFESRGAAQPVSDVLNAYIESRANKISEEGFQLKLSDQSDGSKVRVYEAQVLDILDRLVNNAIKFKSDRREIEIHSHVADGEVTIEVRDRGIGLDVSRVKEAIDVFGQLDRDRLEQQGGGMGLAIANRYATINSGRLEFENRRDGGSIVSLILPLVT